MVSQSMSTKASDKPTLTKRARRALGSHPSTTWQQQPRIKSAAARAKAYITYAGLNDDTPQKADGKSKKSDKNNISAASDTSKNDILDPQLDLHSPEVRFGRMLGGTDQRSRHKAVKLLKEYLKARADMDGSGISELDLMKLWKGLWYTLYMADKVPVQDKLSKILAELMWCLAGSEEDDEYAGQVYLQMEDGEVDGNDDELDGDEDEEQEEGDDDMEGIENEDVDSDDDEVTMEVISDGRNIPYEGEEDDEDEDQDEDMGEAENDAINNALEKHCRGAHLVSLYVATFLRTVRREWGNVDKHRVDKFYTAVRFMMSEAYKYMAKRHWNLGIIRLFNDVLYEEALSQTPNGLRYHLIDICVEELAKANKEASLGLTEATFLDCLEPFFALAQKAVDKNVHLRVMNNVLLKFLNDYSFVCDAALAEAEDGGNEEEVDEAKSLIFDQVHVGTVAKFIFEVASDEDTDDRFRKALYEMHKTYVRQIRSAGRDVDLDDSREDEHSESSLESGDKLTDISGGNGEGSCCENAECQETCAAKNEAKSSGKKKKKGKSDAPSDEKPEKENSSSRKLDMTPKLEEKSATKNEDDAALSTEKKKKKKKKKGNKTEHSDGKDTAEEDHTTESKAAVDDVKQVVKEEINGTSTPTTTPSKKKRKKKANESAKNDASDPGQENKENESNLSTTKPTETPTPKKKKQKQTSPPAVNPRSMVDSDGVDGAKKLVIQDDNTPPSSDGETPFSESASKRVSFGKMNRCKSYKASMKALKTLDQQTWSTANRTPDKSILHRKGSGDQESAVKSTGTSSRKKKKGKKQK